MLLRDTDELRAVNPRVSSPHRMGDTMWPRLTESEAWLALAFYIERQHKALADYWGGAGLCLAVLTLDAGGWLQPGVADAMQRRIDEHMEARGLEPGSYAWRRGERGVRALACYLLALETGGGHDHW